MCEHLLGGQGVVVWNLPVASSESSHGTPDGITGRKSYFHGLNSLREFMLLGETRPRQLLEI